VVNIQENVLLSNYSTFGIGGDAEYLCVVSTRDELIEALDWATRQDLASAVIGSGSNILFSDAGFRGLVIVNRSRSFTINNTTVTADSGVNFGQLARKTMEQGLIGLHFGAGIPGTIGGAVVGNAGALDFDISKTLVSAEVFINGKVETWQNADFGFDYRNSKIKNNPAVVILSVVFKLKAGDTADILVQIHDDQVRRGKSYIGKTCGSYFKNPEGKSAGELIDSLGLKGFRIGDAEISTLHANVIRNVGNANATDVLDLEKYIQSKAWDKYKIRLTPEIVKIGF